MRNPGLHESQAGIKTGGRNINNLRYSDNNTFMAESKEELKSLLMKVKEESEKPGLKFSIQKTRIMASGPITLWKREKQWKQWQTLFSFFFSFFIIVVGFVILDFIFLGSKVTVDSEYSHETAPWKTLASLEGKL